MTSASEASPPLAPDRARDVPDWGLLVCTLNRPDALRICVACALAQDPAPAEVIIVDASDDPHAGREAVAGLCEAHPQVRLLYLAAVKRSTAVQRNQAIEASRAEVLFLLDDDSWMHPGCAAAALAIYAEDVERRISAVSAVDVSTPPSPEAGGPEWTSAAGADAPERKNKDGKRSHALANRNRLTRFLYREVLLMSAGRLFVAYDGERPARQACTEDGHPVIEHLSGHLMTVRREIAVKEPMDAHLLAYAAAEELDASYRWSRHGAIVMATGARIHHFEMAAGRVKRRQATTLSLLNTAYFVRRSSTRPLRHSAAWGVMLVRRIVAEALKDALTRRWDFPQFRGACAAVVRAPAVLLHDRATLGPWYETVQADVLKR